MGMLDPKEYLTGTAERPGAVKVGDVFKIHNARVTGPVQVSGRTATEVKLLVSTEARPEPFIVFTTGAGIVSAVERMDDADRQKMANGGMTVKLGQVDTGKGNPANILVAPEAPTVATGTTNADDEDIPF
jgi:hypothetical protein